MFPEREPPMHKVLVVIPTYNEAENIVKLIPAVLGQSQAVEMLIVDDSSPDGTGTIVRGLMKSEPRIHLIERPGKMGLGTAYVAGFTFAIGKGYEYVMEMDADFSHDPDDIPRFLEKVRECDVVLGSRYKNGVRVLDWPMQRLLLSYSANVYTQIMTGLPLHDATGGFKCFRRQVLESIDLSRIKSNGYAFQIEMSYKLWKKGFRLEELPIVFHDRRSGVSKMSRKIVYEAVFMLLTLRLRSIVGRL
jgi:dolichol-phosphate mannosyltransferase